MGLLIHTSFDTDQGIPVTSVYCKIRSLICDIQSRTKMQVVIRFETYVSRDKKNEGCRRLPVPNVPEYIVRTTPLTSGWNDLPTLYGLLKTYFEEELQFVTEDVLEPPCSEPEPASEPTQETPPEV